MEKYKEMKNLSNKEWRICPTRNEEFELHDVSYFVPDIQDYFKYIIIKHETVTDNLPIKVYVNQIEKRIIFTIKL